MKIKFEKDVLNQNQWFPILDLIIIILESGRHGIDDNDIEDIFESEWLKSRPFNLREIIKYLALSRSTDRHADKSIVIIDAKCSEGGIVDFNNFATRLHPLEAITYLSTPFQVIVENEWYDGAFLLWVAKATGFDKLIRAYRQGKFTFRHAGGKDAFPRCAEILSKGVWPRDEGGPGRAMRLWAAAFMDSDARYPGHEPNEKIVEATKPHVTFVYRLRKRSIESYIPEHFLKAFRSDKKFQRKISALSRLEPEQRLHFHMKTGFRYEKSVEILKKKYMESSRILPEEKILFGKVAESDFSSLGVGFGDSLSEIYVDRRFRPSGNDRNFKNEDDRSEVLKLCHDIYERL